MLPPRSRIVFRLLALALSACVVLMLGIQRAQSQAVEPIIITPVPQVVGGVAIDAGGVLRKIDMRQQEEVRKARAEALQDIPPGLNQQGPTLRKISLKQLQQAALESVKSNAGKLPDEVRFLTGMQRVRYVFVYPELKDVVLIGPAEGWRVNKSGEVVGMTTGRPVLQFDDLLVALRTAASHRRPITCSIGPTEEGNRRYKDFINGLRQHGLSGPPREQTIELAQQAMGLQNITLMGIDTSTHFARVLVAADYQMKRLAMGFEPSPVREMPSLVRMSSGKSQYPRLWLQDDYMPLLTDGEGLAWELRGQGVKTMTEEEMLGADGRRHGIGRVDPVAQKWADNMTNRYEELSIKETIFAQLRNCMDLAVISALVVSENLPDKAGLDLSPLFTAESLRPDRFESPRQVPSLVNAIHKAGGWLMSASGGVSVNAWRVAAKHEKSTQLPSQRDLFVPPAGTAWWYN